MSVRKIKEGQIYRHFKGTLHQVIALAKDSETLKEKVVYNHLDTKEIWVRDKVEFLSKVDIQKYPNTTQEYRFELIENPLQKEK